MRCLKNPKLFWFLKISFSIILLFRRKSIESWCIRDYLFVNEWELLVVDKWYFVNKSPLNWYCHLSYNPKIFYRFKFEHTFSWLRNYSEKSWIFWRVKIFSLIGWKSGKVEIANFVPVVVTKLEIILVSSKYSIFSFFEVALLFITFSMWGGKVEPKEIHTWRFRHLA